MLDKMLRASCSPVACAQGKTVSVGALHAAGQEAVRSSTKNGELRGRGRGTRTAEAAGGPGRRAVASPTASNSRSRVLGGSKAAGGRGPAGQRPECEMGHSLCEGRPVHRDCLGNPIAFGKFCRVAAGPEARGKGFRGARGWGGTGIGAPRGLAGPPGAILGRLGGFLSRPEAILGRLGGNLGHLGIDGAGPAPLCEGSRPRERGPVVSDGGAGPLGEGAMRQSAGKGSGGPLGKLQNPQCTFCLHFKALLPRKRGGEYGENTVYLTEGGGRGV